MQPPNQFENTGQEHHSCQHKQPDSASRPVAMDGQQSKTNQTSILGKGLSIAGQSIDIVAKGLLMIDGEIEGDLRCDELMVGESGSITGSIVADMVVVRGSVNGVISGAQVVLQKTGTVCGDIHYGSFTMEQGAIFDGSSRKIMPTLDTAQSSAFISADEPLPPQQQPSLQRPTLIPASNGPARTEAAVNRTTETAALDSADEYGIRTAVG